MANAKALLIITDGIGCKPNSLCNAFKAANKPMYEQLFTQSARALVSTHGMHVGLPQGQMGNSEVGHMILGSGRVLYQDLVKISLAAQEGSLQNNSALVELFGKTNRIHLVGLLSDGGVHSHIEHTIALITIAKRAQKELFLHLITDGRDVAPDSAKGYIEQIEAHCGDGVKIATLGGRYYAMDRDSRWERVEAAYGAMVSASPSTSLSPTHYLQSSYEEQILDEFVKPVAFEGYEGMQEGDGVIMTNFRSDRARELSAAFVQKNFEPFTQRVKGLHLVTMTNYDKNLDACVMFPKEEVEQTLAEVLANKGKSQMHIAETEKYAHVTFFFNGGRELPYPKESRVLIPSPDVATYDLQPQMSAPEVSEAVQKSLDEGYDFVVVNFANGDMVGHTGNFEAATKAVEAVDKELGVIIPKALALGYSVVLTSDHGNCEEMADEQGNRLTNHTVGDVWTWVIAQGVESIEQGRGLDAIAPTVLKLMDIEIPQVMSKPLF